MKATLIGLADFIDNCRVACLVMRHLVVLGIVMSPLPLESMTTGTKYKKEAGLGVFIRFSKGGTQDGYGEAH